MLMCIRVYNGIIHTGAIQLPILLASLSSLPICTLYECLNIIQHVLDVQYTTHDLGEKSV